MPLPFLRKLRGPWRETLRDRSQVLIRPFWTANAGDWPDLLGDPYRACRHLSFTGRLSGGKPLPAGPEDAAAARPRLYAATLRENAHERLIGMGKFQSKLRGTGCECAIAVLDTQPSPEIDLLLMRHLIGMAHAQGMRDLVSVIPESDVRSSELLHQLGFRARIDPVDPTKLVHELTPC